MITETTGRLFFDFDEINGHYFCENFDCKYNKQDKIYSWKHAKDIGWVFKIADVDLYNNKLSNTNKELKDSSGKCVELYCPDCGKEI